MIKTYDVHMDPLERTSQIITLTEVINDILVSNSPSLMPLDLRPHFN